MSNEQDKIKSIIKGNAKTFVESDNIEMNGEQLDSAVKQLSLYVGDCERELKKAIYTDLMSLAEHGEYENLRREVENYFNEDCECDQ